MAKTSLFCTFLVATLALAGCGVDDTSSLAPERLTSGNAMLAADPRVTDGPATAVAVQPVKGQRYGLAALIDMAQENNPATRGAWQTAKAAATSVGLVDAAYMPRLSAEVLAGYQKSNASAVQDPLGILPSGTATTGVGAGAAVLSAQWLLFDFGIRSSARKQAQELSFASNAVFTGVHQKLILDVSTAYYNLWAAEQRLALQQKRLIAVKDIADQVAAKQAQELATVSQRAAADQLVAQAQFDLTRAQSETRVAQTALTTVVGVSPRQPVLPAFPARINLPARVPSGVDSFMTEALQRRPDLQAAFAKARASEANIKNVQGQYLPKVVGSASVGRNGVLGSYDDSRYGSVSGDRERDVAGVFVGISIPLWSAGAKEQRLKAAQAEHAASVADAEALRNAAEGQIMTAYETLTSSLAANRAANSLVATAVTANDAERARFKEGLASVADVGLSERNLYDAQMARIEAEHSALNAAALLAFSSGAVVKQ